MEAQKYERGVFTVLCNETGGLLRTAIKVNGEPLEIGIDADGHGESIDLEDILRPSAIDHSGVNLLIAKGLVSIHRKREPGEEMPKGRKADKIPAVNSTAPPNNFDHAFDALVDRDRKRDEQTEHVDRKRAEGRTSAVVR